MLTLKGKQLVEVTFAQCMAYFNLDFDSARDWYDFVEVWKAMTPKERESLLSAVAEAEIGHLY